MQDEHSDIPDLEEPPPLRDRLLRGLRSVVVSVVLIVGIMLVVGWLRSPSLPDEAPPFVGFDLEGNQVTLADYAGQTVVLNFWATWCGPCRVEAPSFSSFAEAHPEVAVLGLAIDGPRGKVRQVAKDIGITYRVITVGPKVADTYQVAQLPTTVIVNPDGSVRWAHAGMMFRPQLAWLTGYVW